MFSDPSEDTSEHDVWHSHTLYVSPDTVLANAVTTLLFPPQTGSSDNCECIDEEAVLNAQLQRGLLVMGWIHTHPRQRSFLSAIDLHTSASYQCLYPRAVAMVVAPTDAVRPLGVFRLTERGLESVLRCPLRGFHPHDASDYGAAADIVWLNDAPVEGVDLRTAGR